MNIKILSAGTFDKFHKGHESFLEQAKNGDNSKNSQLFVIVAREKNVEKIKKRKPRDSEEKRLENVKKNKNVDHIFLGDETDFLSIPKKINPDILCVGYDQHIPQKFYEEFPNCKIKKMKPFFPEKYKSSLMK